jgi:photosystem II stability/assembly factor-like uncharacterized protein
VNISMTMSAKDDTLYGLMVLGQRDILLARLSGLHRTNDGGANWGDAYGKVFGGAQMPTTSLAFSQVSSNESILVAGVSGGVVRSLDQGETWQAVQFTEPAPVVTVLTISPSFSADRTIFAGSAEDGVFCSRDGGVSWDAWNFGLFDPNLYSLAVSTRFQSNRRVYAGTSTGVFVSPNGGYSWQLASIPGVEEVVLSLAALPAGGEDEILLAGCEQSGLFTSIDAGKTWERAEGLPGGEPVSQIITTNVSPEMVYCLAQGKVFRSVDAGRTFSLWASSNHPPDFAPTLLSAHGTSIWAASDTRLIGLEEITTA